MWTGRKLKPVQIKKVLEVEQTLSPLIIQESTITWKERSVQFIQKFEWIRLKAYWDKKQWSIWHGTKSKRWEVITTEEADRRMLAHLDSLYKLVDNSSCFSDNQKIALTSYMYNTWGYQMNLRTHIKQCNHKDIKYIMSVWGYWSNWERLQWLVNRRTEELNLYNK